MQNPNGILHEQRKALVQRRSVWWFVQWQYHTSLNLSYYFPLISKDVIGLLHSCYLTACSQVSPDQPVHPHLSLLSRTADELLFHTGNSRYRSPRLKLCMTLHSTLLNVILFLSLRSTKSSKFLSYDNLILLRIDKPPNLVSSHMAPGPSPQVRAAPVNRRKPGPLGATALISLHPDDFLSIPLPIQTTLCACNCCVFSSASSFSTLQFLYWTTIFILSHVLWGMVSNAWV